MQDVTPQSMDRPIRSTCGVCGAVQETEQDRTDHKRNTGHRHFDLSPRGPAYFVRTS